MNDFAVPRMIDVLIKKEENMCNTRSITLLIDNRIIFDISILD